jgi:hypothetical protein
MTIMKGVRVLLFAGVLSVAGVTAVGAETAGPAFVPALLSSLENDGWSLQERTALAEAAGRFEWEGAQVANAEAVALALSLQRNESLQLSAAEQVRLAQQLAIMASEMRAAGFDDHDTAVAAVSAIRNALGEIRAWMSGGRHGELGEIMRSRIAAAVRHQVQVATMSQSPGKGPDDNGGTGQGRGAGMGMQGSGGALGAPGKGR